MSPSRSHTVKSSAADADLKALVREVVREELAARAVATEAKIACSFCAKPNSDDVAVMIAGLTAYICDECVDLSAIIVADKRRGPPAPVDAGRG